MKKILIVGNLANPHLIRLVNSIISSKEHHSQYIIEGFSFNTEVDVGYLRKIGYERIYSRRKFFPSFIYKLQKIRFLFNIIDFLLSFRKVHGSFSTINIHYLTIESFFLYPMYRKKSSKIVLTPWGSDVYRIPKYYLFFFKYLYRKADYVTLPPIKFRDDAIKKFAFNANKIVDIGFGSTIVDLILNNSISREKAQELLGLDNQIVITCGYNANINQQHIAIIKSFCEVEKYLPQNILLIFLMTYNEEVPGYIMQVENMLGQTDFSYRVYKEYLDDNTLFYIQKSTNIFIHVQKTDAFSAFVQENILCGNIVINGAWLRYPQLEIDTIPYYLLDNIYKIGNVVLDILNKKTTVTISEATKNYISQNSWSILGQKWDYFFENS